MLAESPFFGDSALVFLRKGELMKYLKKFFALTFVLLSVMLTGCSTSDKDVVFSVDFPYTVDNGIVVEEFFLYSGVFPEDGSFDKKKDIAALRVKNDSGSDLQLIRIYVETDLKELIFEITALPVGKGVVVLEKNAQTMTENEEVVNIRAENRVNFDSSVSLCTETFLVTVPGQVFNIKNISDTDINSDIYVYYKKIIDDDYYFGGITFRSKAEGLNAGELKQIPAGHFDSEDSEVVFIDYGE